MNIGPIIRAMTNNKTRFVLIMLEVAFTLAIVTNCVNMILDERKKMTRASGFDDANLVRVRLRPFTQEYREDQFVENMVDRDLRAIKAVPGVKAATNTNFVPWQGGGSSTQVRVAGKKGDVVRTQMYYSTPELFDTLGTPITQGRGLNMGDYEYPDGGNPTSIVVSKALADLMFSDGKAVGKALQFSDSGGTDVSEPMTIVGMIDEFYNPYGWPIHEYAILAPSRVGSYERGLRYLIRTENREQMQSVVAAVEKALTANHAGRTFEAKTIIEYKDGFFTGGRIVVTAMTAVIVVLVFVTALGILGITSLAVAERTKQIGTRRALGATRRDILTHFLLENWLVTTAGLLLGLVATYGLNFILVSKVSGVKMEWELVAIGMLLLWTGGLAATIPPALRGMKVSPAIATRSV